jgi:hypothetical protein
MGLAPMIFETSPQARYLIPMAIALGFGVMFSAAVVLLMMPTCHLIVRGVGARLAAGPAPISGIPAAVPPGVFAPNT